MVARDALEDDRDALEDDLDALEDDREHDDPEAFGFREDALEEEDEDLGPLDRDECGCAFVWRVLISHAMRNPCMLRSITSAAIRWGSGGVTLAILEGGRRGFLRFASPNAAGEGPDPPRHTLSAYGPGRTALPSGLHAVTFAATTRFEWLETTGSLDEADQKGSLGLWSVLCIITIIFWRPPSCNNNTVNAAARNAAMYTDRRISISLHQCQI